MSIIHSQPCAEFGLSSGELRLVVVDSNWSTRFVEERCRIAAALGESALDIQHIGSTAVPGITAKPVLDIAVAIADFEAGHALVPHLVTLGYTYLGENGIPRRHFFVRAGAYHLHMFEQGSSDWQRHLRFRDRLLTSAECATRYSLLKQSAAGQANGNREYYQKLKSSFIEEAETL
jgi:GrpB-like predicted nucleotidyltransferase (UPF0157 family)